MFEVYNNNKKLKQSNDDIFNLHDFPLNVCHSYSDFICFTCLFTYFLEILILNISKKAIMHAKIFSFIE
jgi:hypothetical protein